MPSSRWRIRIGELWGAPVYLDASWFLILLLVTWSLAVGILRPLQVTVEPVALWTLAAGGALLYLLCVLLHEAAHCWVAQREKLQVNDITLFLFGGIANIRGDSHSAASELRIAIAGPVANLALTMICYAEGLALDQFAFSRPIAQVFFLLCVLNWFVAAFNLVPAFPLDGGRVLRAALWIVLNDRARATDYARLLGKTFALTFMMLGAWALLQANPLTGIWLLLLGGFVFNAAAQEGRSFQPTPEAA